MNDRDPTYNYRMQARDYACGKLKETVRAAFAKRTTDSGPRGPVILEAVEALPDARHAGDWTKFNALTEEEQKSLRAFITQTEVSFTANEVIKLVDENFPDQKH